MTDEAVPDHGLKRLRVGRDGCRIDRGHNHGAGAPGRPPARSLGAHELSRLGSTQVSAPRDD